MSYTKKTWEDLPSTNTPVNADGLNDLETRIKKLDDNIYSLEEQVIGTWMGKPLYRKVFTISSPQSSNTNYADLSSLNINNIVNLYGYYKKDGGDMFSIPFYDSAENYSVIFVNASKQLRGRFGTPTTIADVKVVIEYTKTTD